MIATLPPFAGDHELKRAIVLMPSLLASHGHIVGHYETRMLDLMCLWSDPAESLLRFYLKEQDIHK